MVGSRFENKELTYEVCDRLPMVADLHIRPPNLKSLHRILTGLSHITTSRLCPRVSSWELGESSVMHISGATVGVWGLPLPGSSLGQLMLLFSGLPPPTTIAMLKEERKLKLYYILNEIHRKQKKEDNRKETNI